MLEPSKILYVVRKVKSVCTSRNDKSDTLNAARDALLLLSQLFIYDKIESAFLVPRKIETSEWVIRLPTYHMFHQLQYYSQL